jgi:uncharacterized protein (DUF3084 family)
MSASAELPVIAEEIRKHAEVYRTAMQLAELLDLAAPFEEAVERAREEAEEARKAAEAARAEQARAERDRDAAKREHGNAIRVMVADMERREVQWVRDMKARNSELTKLVADAEAALLSKQEQLQEVKQQLDRLRELLK